MMFDLVPDQMDDGPRRPATLIEKTLNVPRTSTPIPPASPGSYRPGDVGQLDDGSGPRPLLARTPRKAPPVPLTVGVPRRVLDTTFAVDCPAWDAETRAVRDRLARGDLSDLGAWERRPARGGGETRADRYRRLVAAGSANSAKRR